MRVVDPLAGTEAVQKNFETFKGQGSGDYRTSGRRTCLWVRRHWKIGSTGEDHYSGDGKVSMNLFYLIV